MSLKEYAYPWTLTSTGAGAWLDTSWAFHHTFVFQTSTVAGNGAAFQIETRLKNSTLTSVVGSTLSLGAKSNVVVTLMGTYSELRPHVTASTGTVFVQATGVS